jgi:hypothetical protein
MILPPWVGGLSLSLEDVDVGTSRWVVDRLLSAIWVDQIDFWLVEWICVPKTWLFMAVVAEPFCVGRTIFQTIAPFRLFVG